MAPTPSWTKRHAARLATPREALSHLKNGQTVFVGSGAAEPRLLTEALEAMAPDFWAIEIIHLAAARRTLEFAAPGLADHFRTNTFTVGRPEPSASSSPAVDATPMRLSELPAAFADGVILVDVALIQVAPPDELGLCSLGVSVDVVKAAVESASLVIAQVNEAMPVTLGDSHISVEDIDILVEGTRPLLEAPLPQVDPVTLTIGRHVADLIRDGMTLHFDGGAASAATMRHLDAKKDLGIHTDVLTDDLLRLIRTRAVTNRRKQTHKGRSVATMVQGSEELYRWVHRNPSVEILPIDSVSDPFEIASNDRMVAVLSIEEIDLTGLPRSDTEIPFQASRLPSSMDFLNGARRSKGGFSVLALPSTTPDGTRSRIVAEDTGRGVAFSRARVDYVVTEYGVVNLHGLSIRERAIALVSIAHPRFRTELLEAAKGLGYVNTRLDLPAGLKSVYPHHYEFTHDLESGGEIRFRPLKPSDARRVQRFFYSLSPEAVRLRYHGSIKVMTNDMAQKLATVDFDRDMAIVGLVGPRRSPRIVAEGRYMYNPANNMGEFDILVHEDYRRRGIGAFLASYLKKIAYTRGLSGVYAEVIQDNAATVSLLNRAWPTSRKTYEAGNYVITVEFPPADVRRPKDSIIVYSGRFGDFTYGEDHPFNPGRARTTLRLIRENGFLDEPWMRVEEPRPILPERLVESHDPGYVAALEKANDGEMRPEFEPYNLGTEDCPVFKHLFDYVLLYTSATITGVDFITQENANVVFNPLGGFHHASRTHAEGFCYVNDAIVAIDMLLARGFKVAYLDIDAHAGNGVQDAYYRDDRVLVVSIHQSGKTLYPRGCFEDQIGEDIGRGVHDQHSAPQGDGRRGLREDLRPHRDAGHGDLRAERRGLRRRRRHAQGRPPLAPQPDEQRHGRRDEADP